MQTMQPHKTTIIVNGATGRTGARVCELARRDDRFELVAALTHEGSSRLGEAVPCAIPTQKHLEVRANTRDHAEVVIDFSTDSGARSALRLALDRGAGLLVATTALSETTRGELHDGGKKIPIILAANTSLGVAAVADAVARLSRALGGEFAASIVEAHHIRKKDAPSGTALRLASAVRSGGAAMHESQVLSIRAGDIVGEHMVRFTGSAEEIIVEHRAMSRDVFAAGALRAALWLRGRAPGWYTMEDVLGFAETGR
ncbi:MAG: 4-hydroxy-tetrahydrodipicolinate reductase [Phycisphaeraceae bacterium]|nr:4-hydroxy-tetrahydrodipicolinate reductase [Phycisphaeraceae bacterium]